MRNIFLKILSVGLLAISAVGCDDFLDINQDPINPVIADVNLLLPAAQGGLAFAMNDDINQVSSILSQHYYNLTYSRYSLAPSDYNTSWRGSYVECLNNTQAFINQSEDEGFSAYVGIGQILKAYTFTVLVDLWGDIPFSEALNGAENFSPAVDNGEDIYAAIFTMLDSAEANINADTVELIGGPATDMYYQGDLDQWKLALNTLRLKLHLQTRTVDAAASTAGIDALISGGSYINDTDDDFEFLYSTGVEPDNRHPLYETHYQPGKTYYMSNYFMDLLLNGRNIMDPRTRYYIKRQTLDDPEGDDLPCQSRNDCPIGYVGLGYIGRDHGDPTGLPPDNGIRSTFGSYPIGGSFDDNEGATVEIGDGLGGAGVCSFLTHSWTQFMLAESALTLNTAGDARDYLEEGMRSSIEKVQTFGTGDAAPDEDDVDGFVNSVLGDFDAADDAGKLEIVMEQAYIAQFGHGYEAYVGIRRTGFPTQPASMEPTANFPLRFLFPVGETASNANLDQNNPDEPVFWDN